MSIVAQIVVLGVWIAVIVIPVGREDLFFKVAFFAALAVCVLAYSGH